MPNDEGSRNSFVCNLRVNCSQECAIFMTLEALAAHHCQHSFDVLASHTRQEEKCQRLISECFRSSVFLRSLAAKLIKVKVIKEHNLLVFLWSPRTLKVRWRLCSAIKWAQSKRDHFCALFFVKWSFKAPSKSDKKFAKRLRKIISQLLYCYKIKI